MEVKLWNDEHGREMFENLSELYAIIKATETLEMIFVCDDISSADYERECWKLIAQFKTLSATLRDTTMQSVERFLETYYVDCPAAINRLMISGVPATVEVKASTVALADLDGVDRKVGKKGCCCSGFC